MKKFLGIFILGLLWCNVGIADNSKLSPIGEMYKNCTSYIKLIRSENSNLSQDEQLSAILCDEFFAGLYGGIIFQSASTAVRLKSDIDINKVDRIFLGSCMGDPKYKKNTSNLNTKIHLIKLFVRYVEDNPKRIKEKEKDRSNFHLVVRVVDLALREKYPCN